MNSAKLLQVRLQHILEQIDGIVAATQGIAFAQVNGNFLYERAVELAVQIISDATKELPADQRSRYANEHWQPIVGIGNLLRHEYYRIKSRDMWEIGPSTCPRCGQSSSRC